ncbi:ABC transporter ATP-binding protein [Lentibacillus cibarius]|uniref:Carnitine transport ATP-binding protein OpuCA n=1 Tax=Lentibacillus cibarius TaxID=2583219 RepID=A0A5S3QLK0_9BACI|nr:ABC transporter ATP-binding protein [Lentibacillus cibarius]TMN22617.1 ABC transporter ATP-binding protein [Lentibacillus cibarius]
MGFVTADNIKKQFGSDTVLKQVSLSLEKGEFATLLGQSGCGKSTLMRCIAGLNKTDGGAIYIDGKNVTDVSPKDRQVGMVFQSYALFPNMTVFDNIAFGLRMKKLKNFKEEVHKMIEMMGLKGKEDSYPQHLSGGQMQRVALARSLILQPKVLLLDEPLSALDAKIRKNLQKELKRIQREFKITTIFVTHDQEEAMTLSDTVHLMDEGRIVQSGAPKEIYTSPTSIFIASFIGNYNILKKEDFKRLTGSEKENFTEVAIRPEVIKIVTGYKEISTEKKVHYTVTGVIGDISMIGNVVRYEVEAADYTFQVDSLNDGGNHLWEGKEITVTFSKADCLFYRNGESQSDSDNGHNNYRVTEIK